MSITVKADNWGSGGWIRWQVYYTTYGSGWIYEGTHLLSTDVNLPDDTNYIGCYLEDAWGRFSQFYESPYVQASPGDTLVWDIQNNTLSIEWPNSDFSGLDVEVDEGDYEPGDEVYFDFVFIYKGPPQYSYYTSQLKKGTSVIETYPQVPITNMPGSSQGQEYNVRGSITLPGSLEGGDYRLKVTVEAADGEDESDHSASDIHIAEAPESNIVNGSVDISVTPGTYGEGDQVPFEFEFEYSGPEQYCYTTLEITNVGYQVKYSYPKGTFQKLAESVDPIRYTGSGAVTLPGGVLDPGDSYRLKITVETADGEETESDNSAADIKMAEEAEYPDADIGSLDMKVIGGGTITGFSNLKATYTKV